MRERWEAESTAYNLRLIREARARRGEQLAWAMQVEDALKRRAGGRGDRRQLTSKQVQCNLSVDANQELTKNQRDFSYGVAASR